MEAQAKGNFLYDLVLPKVELINWFVFGSGLLLRCYFLVAAGSKLLLIGLMGLAVVYFLRAFEPSKNDIVLESTFNNTISTTPLSEGIVTVISRQLVAFGSATTLLGVAFKLRFWTGPATMLPVGIGILLLAIAWQSSVGILTRQTVLIASLGVFAWSIPTDALIRQLFRDDPVLVEKLVYQQQHPHDRAAAEEAELLIATWHKRKR